MLISEGENTLITDMVRKALLYFVIPVTVILSVLLLLKDHSPFGSDNSSFSVDPEREITRIEFSEGDRRLVLEKGNGGWIVNGREEARKSSIAFILRILTEMQIKSTISPAMFEKEITSAKVEPVRVKVWGHGKRLKTFLVYKTGSNIYCNIMKIDERAKPFILYVPGTETGIGTAFNVNELYWQSYSVFSLMPSDIVSVDFENIADTSASFVILNRKGNFDLSANSRSLYGWDTSRVARYLSYYAFVPFEQWIFDRTSLKDSLERIDPAYRITVVNLSGEKSRLTLWEKWFKENGTDKRDNDRLFGKTDVRDDIFIIRYTDIDPLLKKRSYFFLQ